MFFDQEASINVDRSVLRHGEFLSVNWRPTCRALVSMLHVIKNGYQNKLSMVGAFLQDRIFNL